MGFEFPANIQRDIQEYALKERISSDEALVKLVLTGLKANKRKTTVSPLTDEELNVIDHQFPGLGLLDDVTEAQWEGINKTIHRMKHARLSSGG